MCKVLDQILSSSDASTNDVFDQVNGTSTNWTTEVD